MSGMDEEGLCRINPPLGAPADEPRGKVWAKWPTVEGKDWCGGFIDKPSSIKIN